MRTKFSSTRLARIAILSLLRAYKWTLSPLLPPSCRYVPTCSEYAMEAIERCGLLRGSWMALRRLLRCHPLVKGGYDPVIDSHGAARPNSMMAEGGNACRVSH